MLNSMFSQTTVVYTIVNIIKNHVAIVIIVCLFINYIRFFLYRRYVYSDNAHLQQIPPV